MERKKRTAFGELMDFLMFVVAPFIDLFRFLIDLIFAFFSFFSW